VLAILGTLEATGTRLWVAGGWGVDALVGRQTRAHRDLDLLVDAQRLEECLGLLAARGYAVETDWLPVRVEVVAPERGWVDVHPVRLAADGCGVQAGLNGTRFDYPADCFATGSPRRSRGALPDRRPPAAPAHRLRTACSGRPRSEASQRAGTREARLTRATLRRWSSIEHRASSAGECRSRPASDPPTATRAPQADRPSMVPFATIPRLHTVELAADMNAILVDLADPDLTRGAETIARFESLGLPQRRDRRRLPGKGRGPAVRAVAIADPGLRPRGRDGLAQDPVRAVPAGAGLVRADQEAVVRSGSCGRLGPDGSEQR